MGGSVKTRELEHLPALDGVRGLAILLVLPHHLRFISEPFDTWSLAWVKFADIGWIGVHLFFVLSGFLITRILLNTQSASNYFSSFYARRVLRILPVYYLTLAVWWFLMPVVSPEARPYDGQFHYLWMFLSNWMQPFHPSGNGASHFWSLAVEEQFYLLWPLAVWRLSPRGVLRLCGAVSLAALGFRSVMLAADWPLEAVYEFTICRMDALALGGAAAALTFMPDWRERLNRHPSWLRFGPSVVFVAGAAVTRLYRQTGTFAMTGGYTILGVAFALWIFSIALSANPLGTPALKSRVLRTAGKYSYATYVFHVPFKMTWDWLLQKAGWTWPPGVVADMVQVVVSASLVVTLAALSYRFLESPILRFKNRFEPVTSLVR